jgi:hypothetical protein
MNRNGLEFNRRQCAQRALNANNNAINDYLETSIRFQLIAEREMREESRQILRDYGLWYERGDFDRGVAGFLEQKGFPPFDDGDPHLLPVE